jgi:hypothetical protein
MIMSRLFKMNLGGCNRKLLAVRLADFADDDGRGIYPSVARLAAETELSERTVQRILADFVKEGILVVVKEATGRPGIANAYDYDLGCLFSYNPGQTGDRVSPVKDGQGVTIERETGDKRNIDGCQGDTRTVIEPPLEPLSEREGASAIPDEDPKKVERKFKAWYPTWPIYLQSSERAARSAFFALTPEERAECIAKTPAFIAAVRATKQAKFTYAAVYLSERAWRRMEDPQDEIGPSTTHAPFSRPWVALLLAEVLKPMATAWPVMTAYQRHQASSSSEAARVVEMERRSKYGWPKASQMVSEQKPATVPALLVGISEQFTGVDPKSDLAASWKAMAERMGWPWPTSGFNRLQLPAGQPDDAIAEFQKRLNEGKGHDDAA